MDQSKKIELEVPEEMQYKVYFTKISSEDRKKVKDWLETQKYETKNEERFLIRVTEAIDVVDYDYWIANVEPSVENGKIYYLKGKPVGVGFSCEQYEIMAKNYAPERGSRLASEDELFLWYGLRIANGLWTLDYVANSSSIFGNGTLPKSAKKIENTGKRLCGGYYDGHGNTYKIVTAVKGFAMVGGCFALSGRDYPIADVMYCVKENKKQYEASGVVVLTK